MASVYGIKKRLEQSGIDPKTVKDIIGNGELTGIIRRMEAQLAPDMMGPMLDSCGCGGGKAYLKQCEKMGKALADRPLRERVAHVNTDTERIVLEGDDTLAVSWHRGEGGRYQCVCSVAVKNGVKVSDLAGGGDSVMPLAYCACCAGSARRHLQLQLGVPLRTKEILSSPINSQGDKPCAFILEAVKE